MELMKRILVVDDNHEILSVIRIILEMEGYQVIYQDNAHHVMQAVFEYNPHLILLDVMIGDMDGREVCKTLKTTPATSHIPVVLISASQHIDPVQCMANDFIPKPFDIEVLTEKVNRQVA
jgi:CheY-like chemotaxis protein